MQQLAIWHQTKLGLSAFAVVEIVAAYGIASFAVNSGALWEYTGAFVLCIGFLRNILKLIWKLTHGRHQAAQA